LTTQPGLQLAYIMKTTKSQTKGKMRGMHKEEKVNTKQKRK
jgi:hypothetical protein